MGLLQRIKSATLGSQFNSNSEVVDPAGPAAGSDDISFEAQGLSAASTQPGSSIDAAHNADSSRSSAPTRAEIAARSSQGGSESGGQPRHDRPAADSLSTTTSRLSRSKQPSFVPHSASAASGAISCFLGARLSKNFMTIQLARALL